MAKRRSNRRLSATLLLVFVVLVAGCAGFSGAGGPVASADNRTDDELDAGDSASGSAGSDAPEHPDGGDDSNALEDVTLYGFGFTRPGTYTYEVAMGQGDVPATADLATTGTIVVDVREVSDENVTLTMSYELGDETFERTFSGDQDDAVADLAMGAGNGSLILTMAIGEAMGSYVRSGRLAVGEGWEMPVSNKTMRFEITGRDSYAGVDCYVGERRDDDVLVRRTCVSPDLGLPAYSALYDANGTADTSIELVKYEPR